MRLSGLKYFISVLILTFCFSFSVKLTNNQSTVLEMENWVDSVMNTFSDEQKLGQLFMAAAYSNKDEAHNQEIEALIRNQKIGGLIFMQGGPVRQAILTNRYQAASSVPLLIGMDAEWGLSMRLDSTISFPKQMTLGALADDSLIFKMGKEIARECKRIGVHISFSPVVDINNNPSNPVIGNRSFGENKHKVTEKSLSYMHGLQKNGVIAVAKHFPGHGDTDADSHLSLPTVHHSKRRLDDVELYPYKKLIKDSLAGVMTGHLYVPSYDNTPNLGASLSRDIVKGILIDKLDFEGLIFTDALNMKGVSKYYKSGELEMMAFKAGNDILLFSENIPLAISKLKEALDNNEISRKDLDKKVRKILKAKYWAGLSNFQPIEIRNINSDLNTIQAKALRYTLFQKALTVLSNKDSLFPIKHIENYQFASLTFGLESNNEFQKTLSKYINFDHYQFGTNYKYDEKEANDLAKKLENKVVVVAIANLNGKSSKQFGYSEDVKKIIYRLSDKSKVIISIFGNPYVTKYFSDFENVIVSYENNEVTRECVPQLIFGALNTNSVFPVTSHEKFKEGSGAEILSLNRLQYSIPEKVGLIPSVLSRIDTIVNKAIKSHAMPGCEILVARHGQVVYEKSFGTTNFDTLSPVKDSVIYDIASISKVVGTLQAFMFLYDQGLVHLDSAVSKYLPEFNRKDKRNITIREVLTHVAGFQAFIDHYHNTTYHGQLSDFYYCNQQDSTYSITVTPTLFARNSLPDSMWKWTLDSHLIAKNKTGDTSCFPYRYSDISFYVIKKIVEKQLNQSLDEFLHHHFFSSLGMNFTYYTPLKYNYPLKYIAPAENESIFRKQLIQGTVHDPGAAMMGGVAGHAGIFSNANDLAKMMQMHLNKGEYGGIQYFKPETVSQFTRFQYANCRRGLGWDKPQFGTSSPTSDYCSFETFGHTGFTGTCVWADPKYGILLVFLSNRTYPNSENKKLITQSVRTKIQDEIYRAITQDIYWKILNK